MLQTSYLYTKIHERIEFKYLNVGVIDDFDILYRTKSGVSREPALLQTSTDELMDSSSVLVRSWSLKKVPKIFYW